MHTDRAILATRHKSVREQVALLAVVLVPFAAVVLAIPFMGVIGVTWNVIALGIALYVVNMLGITVGFHRLFSHRAFRASRWLKISLAIAGSLAIQGPVFHWAADHRRHHAFSDRGGDPHSPWRYGTGLLALIKGLPFAHLGWMFEVAETDQSRFVPDLLADSDLIVVNRLFGAIAAVSVLLPSLLVLACGASVTNAAAALVWAGLVRIFLVHHVTWSVNSVCHVFGQRPFKSHDLSANVWLLAIPSMGESWHNGHHSLPYSARHGLLRRQIDISAALIRVFESLGWATKVRWPKEADIATARTRLQDDYPREVP